MRDQAGDGKGFLENPEEDGLPQHGQGRRRRREPAQADDLHQHTLAGFGGDQRPAAGLRAEAAGTASARPGCSDNQRGFIEDDGEEAQLHTIYLHIMQCTPLAVFGLSASGWSNASQRTMMP